MDAGFIESFEIKIWFTSYTEDNIIEKFLACDWLLLNATYFGNRRAISNKQREATESNLADVS